MGCNGSKNMPETPRQRGNLVAVTPLTAVVSETVLVINQPLPVGVVIAETPKKEGPSKEQMEEMRKLQAAVDPELVSSGRTVWQRPLSILFHFDFEERVFHYFNVMTSEWDKNDLTQSQDNCPRCPLFKYKSEREKVDGIQFAKYMSYIAFNDNTIYIIGGYHSYYSCIEYNISENKFYNREPMRKYRNNPSLFRKGSEIYVISGDLLDAFSTDVEKFHIGKNEWQTLPSLPEPQGFGSVSIINENIDPSLVVLGGLSKKFPRTYVSNLSLFNLRESNWASIDLNKLIAAKVPRFINCAILQTKESEVLILGSEGTKLSYKFDLLEGILTEGGSLENEEVFSNSTKSKEILRRDNRVYCLSHSEHKKIYVGDIETYKWELL